MAKTGGCPASLYMTYVPGDVIDMVGRDRGLFHIGVREMFCGFVDSYTIVWSTNDLMYSSERWCEKLLVDENALAHDKVLMEKRGGS